MTARKFRRRLKPFKPFKALGAIFCPFAEPRLGPASDEEPLAHRGGVSPARRVRLAAISIPGFNLFRRLRHHFQSTRIRE